MAWSNTWWTHSGMMHLPLRCTKSATTICWWRQHHVCNTGRNTAADQCITTFLWAMAAQCQFGENQASHFWLQSQGVQLSHSMAMKWSASRRTCTLGLKLRATKEGSRRLVSLFLLTKQCMPWIVDAPFYTCVIPSSAASFLTAWYCPLLVITNIFACEVWAINNQVGKLTEQLRRHFWSMYLVSEAALQAIILAEFGRFPSCFHWWQQILRYYNRINNLPDDDRLIQCAFLESLHDQAYCFWSHRVQTWLQLQSTALNIEDDICQSGY